MTHVRSVRIVRIVTTKWQKSIESDEFRAWQRLDRETKYAPGRGGREGWRAVPKWPGVWVNKCGGVWFAGLPWMNKLRSRTGLRPQRTNRYGYKVVDLQGGHPFMVHRLVMYTFVGRCPDGMQVDHINGDKADNRLANLEYVTPKENMRRLYARLGKAA